MSKSVLYMSMSLDGFVAGPNETPDNGLGDNGRRLHRWIFEGAETDQGGIPGRPDGLNGEVMDARRGTGAEHWPLVSVLDDVGDAMGRAKEAAGDRDVLVHGVGCAQAALSAGVLDEVQLHLVPTILGEGRRLFEGIGAEPHEFELIRNIEGPGVTHLRYRVVS